MTDSATYITLTSFQVGLAACLILINAAVSLWLQLKLEKTLLLASLRTIVQLSLVGLLLDWVFRMDRLPEVLAIMTVMTGVAGWTAVRRIRYRHPGIWPDTVIAVWLSSWALLLITRLVIIQGGGPWWNPQYVIPLLGMILGNTLNGITLGLSQLGEQLAERRSEVDARLALGATRWEAAREIVSSAIENAMTPIINSMMIVGIVSLPGMMTGQILSGARPLEAVKYQIVIMFVIAGATALGALTATLAGFLRLFSTQHQLLADRLRRVR